MTEITLEEYIFYVCEDIFSPEEAEAIWHYCCHVLRLNPYSPRPMEELDRLRDEALARMTGQEETE